MQAITNYERFKDALGVNIKYNPLLFTGTRQEQVIMAKIRMQCSNLNSHLRSMHIGESYLLMWVDKWRWIAFFLHDRCSIGQESHFRMLYILSSTLHSKNIVIQNRWFRFYWKQENYIWNFKIYPWNKRFEWCNVYIILWLSNIFAFWLYVFTLHCKKMMSFCISVILMQMDINKMIIYTSHHSNLAGARVIIKASGHQYRWLAGGYDLEIGYS